MAPPCGDLLPILLRGQDIWGGRGGGGVYCCQVEVGWKRGGKAYGVFEEVEKLVQCANVQTCKLCSMMMILGPTAPSIIVQRCIQPRSRKDKRFLMNLIALAKVLTILMSISIKLTRNNENMHACLCLVFRPCFGLHKKGLHIWAPKTLEFSCV